MRKLCSGACGVLMRVVRARAGQVQHHVHGRGRGRAQHRDAPAICLQGGTRALLGQFGRVPLLTVDSVLWQVMNGRKFTVVPILVGNTKANLDAEYGK